MSENVEVEVNEVKASNTRASRLARYSTAAAGVAAVSSIEVDAAMIKVIVTDTNAQNTDNYTLDLSSIASGESLTLSQSGSSFFAGMSNDGQVAVGSSSSSLFTFKNGDPIGKSGTWSMGGYYSSFSSVNLFGFRVYEGGGTDFTYGWFKVTGDSSTFTLNSYGYNSTLNAAATAGQGSSAVPDSGPGIFGLALLGAGAAGMRLLRKLRAGK